MIRLENLLPRAFLTGIMKMVDMAGSLETIYWMQSIGKELADIEGPGFEGARADSDIVYLPISPFGNEVVEFSKIYEENPAQFNSVISTMSKLKGESDAPWEFPAMSHVLDVLQHSYNQKRAELAGTRLYNLGSKSPLGDVIQYNDEAIERAGLTKQDVAVMLEKAFFVYFIEHPEKE
ncbi:MAG: hypothetical protein PWP63_393 [Methanolobus sp.]|jgi:hypothetical protein|nr:hypothetical protein [Methanolobus sp.]